MVPMIQLKNLTFTYDEQTVPAINHLSLDINKGEWVSIVGHNGSGKSTLLKLISGIAQAQEGTIYINNIELNEDTLREVYENIGIVFQNPDNQFVGSTVEDDVAFGLENYGVEYGEMHKRVNEALTSVNMAHMKTHEPHHLSGGQKQRVAIAGVIALRPSIIILDEATSMLDPDGRAEILSIIKQLQQEKHLTIIHITHFLEETIDSDRIVVMNKGQIILNDHPHAIFEHAEQLLSIGLDLPFEMKVNRALFNESQFITHKELLEKL